MINDKIIHEEKPPINPSSLPLGDLIYLRVAAELVICRAA